MPTVAQKTSGTRAAARELRRFFDAARERYATSQRRDRQRYKPASSGKAKRNGRGAKCWTPMRCCTSSTIGRLKQHIQAV